MSNEEEAVKDESQALQNSPESKPGKASRVFLTLLTLGLAVTTAVFAYLKDGAYFQDLLAKDAWTSQLIGNLHPVLMLLPIGLIVLVVLVEILGWFSFGKWRPVTLFALFLVVMTTVLAAASGLVLMKLEGNAGPDWTQYLWYGIGAMGAFAFAFICKIWGKNGNGRGFFYAIFLLGGAAALGHGAYHYGQKVHSYSLVPSRDTITTPFGNKLVREKLTTDISALEASTEKLEQGLVKKDQEIATVTSAKQTAETNFMGEQKKVAAAQKNIADLNQKMAAAQKKSSEAEKKAADAQKKAVDSQKQLAAANKKLTEVQKSVAASQKKAQEAQAKIAGVQKQLQASQQEKQKLQQESKALQTQMAELKKKLEQAAKEKASAAADAVKKAATENSEKEGEKKE